ncbi:MAG: ATP synthase F0 subunit B [Deltaproteobacteria bacterium]|nr:ATP synthase F0 subunit B [Deltaproteobacteria bacterium]
MIDDRLHRPSLPSLRRLAVVAGTVGLLAVAGMGPASASGTGNHGTVAPAGEAHGAGHAAGHENHFDNLFSLSFGEGKEKKNPPFGFMVVNFLLLLVVLVKFAGKPFKQFLRQRHERIDKELKAAAEIRAQAQARLKEVETRLSRLDDEIREIKAAVARDAEQEKQQIVAQAHTEAARLIEGADRALAEEIKQVRLQLEAEAVKAALAAAERIVAQQITDGDRGRLEKEYLSQLTQGGVQ